MLIFNFLSDTVHLIFNEAEGLSVVEANRIARLTPGNNTLRFIFM
jgi:hypothetical protein